MSKLTFQISLASIGSSAGLHPAILFDPLLRLLIDDSKAFKTTALNLRAACFGNGAGDAPAVGQAVISRIYDAVGFFFGDVAQLVHYEWSWEERDVPIFTPLYSWV